MTDPIIRMLAIWGAITGTIGTLAGVVGLYLRYKSYVNEGAELVCEAQLAYELINSEAIPDFKIIARSKGKQSVTIDCIRYYLRPEEFFKSLPAFLMWKRGRWMHHEMFYADNKVLEGGRKVELGISLYWGADLKNVAGVSIIDETGREWVVKWPSQTERRKLGKIENIEEISVEQDGRCCKVYGLIAGGEYCINVVWHNPAVSIASKFSREFRFRTKNKYMEKLSDVKTKLSGFISGDAREPL